jgi:hypothetical protein
MRRVERRKMVNRSERQRYAIQALDKAWMILSTVGLAKRLHCTALESAYIYHHHLAAHLSSLSKIRRARVSIDGFYLGLLQCEISTDPSSHLDKIYGCMERDGLIVASTRQRLSSFNAHYITPLLEL